MKLFKLLLVNVLRAASKPNVIVLICDDFGAGDFQVNNQYAKVPTPNIDRLANEGVNFKDAHAGSSRCGPSRYMMMTGRYSMSGEKSRMLFPNSEPHLGKMFHDNGYNTALFGKAQPLKFNEQNGDLTWQESADRHKKVMAFKKEHHGINGDRTPGMENKWFFELGQYYARNPPAKYFYHEAFTAESPCCHPGGYYKNGIAIETTSKYAIQRNYPEYQAGMKRNKTAENAGLMFPISGYVGPPYFDKEVLGPILMGNYPKSILVQESYDSRTQEDVVSEQFFKYIDENAAKPEPFFAYYGMRSGHRPFNSPERFRNKTKAGVVGEMIMEADELIGKLFDTLQRNNIDENTLIIFMSDNGADQSRNFAKNMYGHDQNSIDFKGEHISLRNGKNNPFEGGHRLPFMWRFPKMFPSQVNENSVVSYVDVYRTLADLIGYTPKCNEGPDSRSLMSVLKGNKSFDGENKGILTHAVYGSIVTIRQGKWKRAPGIDGLFDMERDIAETTNLVNKSWGRAVADRLDGDLKKWVNNINTRELRTNKGANGKC